MQLRWSIWTVGVVILGCDSASRRVNGPDGEPGWYSVSCRRDLSNCEDEAAKVCPRGYVSAGESEREHPVVATTVTTSNAYGLSTSVDHKVTSEILIKCR